MAEGRLKHFGWGREGEGLTDAEEAAALDRYRRLFRVDRFDEVAPPALSEIRLRPPRIAPPAALAAELFERGLRPRRPHLRQVVPRLCARPGRRLRRGARRRRLSAQRSRGRRGDRLGGRRAGRGDPVRRRQQRRRRRRAAIDGTRYKGGGHPRPAASRPGLGDRPQPRARRGSRPASSARRSKRSSARMG